MGFLPERKRPAHPPPVERFNAPTVLFVTVCIEDRRNLLNTYQAMDAVVSAWRDAQQWAVGEFLLMPDHAHLFCVPGVQHPESIRRWNRYWKRLAGERCNELKHRWQLDGWDTQMRDRDHYLEKLEYVRQNPVRAGLVEHWEDWPYRGCLHQIRW